MRELQALRSFDPSGGQSVEEMVAMLAFAEGMVAVYERLGEVPEWLSDKVRELNKALADRMRDELERQLRETEAAMETLKSREERKGDLAEKAARLKAKLSGGVKAAA